MTIDVQVSDECTEPGGGTPIGTVDVTDGTQNCTATLSGSAGVANGSCAIIESSAGDYSLNAAYSGKYQYEPSATANSTPISVAMAATSTTVQVAGFGPAVVGQPVTVTAQTAGEYTGAGEPTPTGTVTVNEGTQSCTADLSGTAGKATGSCIITQTSVGTYTLTGAYAGDPNFNSSTTTTTTFVPIAKANSTITLALSNATVAYGQEKSEQMSVNVAPQYPGVTPTGTVTIKSSMTVLCTITLSAGQGNCNLRARTLLAGTYQLVAAYKGDPNFNTSKSARETLTVNP